MHDDDRPVGRVLSRREALSLLGSAGVGGALWLSGCGPPPGTIGNTAAAGASAGSATTASGASLMCVARPEQTEGPYFVDERLERADIRSDPATGELRDGVPLVLTFMVHRIAAPSCTPLAGAMVDIWQCDALGVYSNVTDPRFSTIGQRWLRGFLRTDASGLARFTTIYPGWYQGRAVHIHFKVRSPSQQGAGFEFTSQLYFPDDLSGEIFATRQPYANKGAAGRTLNARDGIFGRGGQQLMLAPTPTTEGFQAEFNLGLYV